MTCKDCIHYEPCKTWVEDAFSNGEHFFPYEEPESWCVDYKSITDVVEVRRGRWLSAYEYAVKIGATDERLIENAKNDKWWKFCCHCEHSVKWDYNYCPNCGAKMDTERSKDELH